MRVSEAASLLGVSDDTVRRWADQGRLEVSRPEADGPPSTAPSWRRWRASWPTRPPRRRRALRAQQPARHRHRVVRDTVMAQVELQAGPFRVVSLMSREAADELALEPGTVAFATVKATNVVVELSVPAARA
jgi:molybdopterin-binding protein